MLNGKDVEIIKNALLKEKEENEKWLREHPRVNHLNDDNDFYVQTQNLNDNLEYSKKWTRKEKKIRTIVRQIKRIEDGNFCICLKCKIEIPRERLLSYLENQGIDLDHCKDCNGVNGLNRNFQIASSLR